MTQELLGRHAHWQTSRQQAGPINIRLALSQGADASAQQMESLIEQLQVVFNNSQYIPGPINIRVDGCDESPDNVDNSEDILEKLRRAAEGINQQPRGPQATPNPFSFFATVLGIESISDEASKVCALLDTQSADNWIACSVIERLELQGRVNPAAEIPCTGAGGHVFFAKGTISVLWTRNSAKSWETEFLVQENAPFDLLLGRKFIVEEGMLVLADPVLVHDHVSRLAPLSKGM